MELLEEKQQSTFVTVFSWILIANNSLVVYFLLQNFVLNLGTYFVPATPTLDNALLFCGALIPAMIFLFIAAGLLKRRNWARVIIISLCWLGIPVLVLGFVANLLSPLQLPMPPEMLTGANTSAGVDAFFFFARVQMFVSIAIWSGFLYWIVRKFKSTEIQEEFSA